MPLIYSVFRRPLFRYVSNGVGQSFIRFLLIFLLSFLSSTILNFLKVHSQRQSSTFSSVSSASSSLSLFSSSHRYFPSDASSLQCIEHEKHSFDDFQPLSNSFPRKRTYTKERNQKKNVSEDLRKEANVALHRAKQLVQEKKFNKARKVFEHGLQLDPQNADLLLEYGQFLADHHQDFIQADHLYSRVLVKKPSDNRALELKRRTSPLVEDFDQKSLTKIDLLLKEFYRIPENSPRLRQAKRDAYYLHIYHSNAIEGNTLNLQETKFIVDHRIAIGGKSLIEQQEVIGLDTALQYVNCTLVNRLNAITKTDLFEIHRRVLGFVNPIEAGRLREEQVYVGSFVPPAAYELDEYLDDFLAWLNSPDETEDLHPIELAALAHYRFVYIHPFIDGNGRTGRLLMNLILMRSAFPPIIIEVSERFTYYSHLDQANDGDIRPFIRFIANCTERTLNEFIQHYHSPNQEKDLERIISIE